MSNKAKSEHPENTNKNYNSQNSEEFILKNKKGSDLSNMERPSQGSTLTAKNTIPSKTNGANTKYREDENTDPNVS